MSDSRNTNLGHDSQPNEINDLVAKNVNAYIKALNKSKKWTYERSGIPKATFFNLLQGKGDINKSIPKLNKLFRINDPFYFYKEEIKLPRNLVDIENDSIKNFSAASFNGTDHENFKETMSILDDAINMIHILKSAKELG